MKFHPLSELFPLMQGHELDHLVADIKANGLREPIWTYEGEILDGRNRWRACESSGVDPRFQEYSGNEPVAFVISLNIRRRNLSSGQKAAVALEVLPHLEAEAKERMRIGGRDKGNQKIDDPGQALDKAAELFDTNRQYIADCKRIREEEPDLYEQIKANEKTITQAKRQLKAEQVRREVSLPDAKYRVIYADPPWSYGNTQPDYHTEQRDHYPVMPLKDICAMPIADICEDNAVLFLWVTSPILEESFQVIKSWGFDYKASFVWDKVKHNMGHYNSVRHEFVLVCVRGSCQPDVKKLYDSVVSIERGEHSRKPELFYEIIETLYPHGKRIELFARAKRKGWDTYGYEEGKFAA